MTLSLYMSDRPTGSHAMPAWSFPFFFVFIAIPTLAFGFIFFGSAATSELFFAIQLAIINGILWAIVAALAFIVKHAAGNKK
jgi:hypothetical protein